MTLKKIFLISVFLLVTVFQPFIFSESKDPFTGTVEVEEGENVINWEENIFRNVAKTNDLPKGEAEKKEEQVKELPVKKDEKIKKGQETNELPDNENIGEPDAKSEKSPEKNEDHGKNSPEWGRYYGENIKLENNEKFVVVDQKENIAAPDEKPIVHSEEPFMFPIDILLWSHGGDGYNAMINTGVRVSYWNIYSTLSVGTDFSATANRPVSIGIAAGGFYHLSDFSVSADLGYEKVWDFGDNASVNDYALGLRAGLSYSVLSWLAISAGAGVNYSIFKDSKFEDGRFIPMFFGGLEFNLIK